MNPELQLAIAYGGGINSTAMLLGLRNRGITPSLITFADTGGERPETYNHVTEVSDWCVKTWGFQITVVHKLFQGKFEGLERECLRKSILPSLAYGRKACSLKYKVEPQQRESARFMKANNLTEMQVAIGYDAMEGHRALNKTQESVGKGLTLHNWYPLIEWGMTRQSCRDLILSSELPLPPKSACFFCPASKRKEIAQLPPDLYSRAIAIEEKAQETTTLGLGRQLHWRDVARDAEVWDWIDEHDQTGIPCGCYDGVYTDTH